MREWKTIDFHIGGEPVRVLTDGYLDLPGQTMMEKRENLKKDLIIQTTIREPRGHAGMYAAVMTKPVNEGSSIGFLFACNDHGFPLFCGHALLGAICGAVQLGAVSAKEDGETRFFADVPSGRVEAVVKREKGRIGKVSFVSQPCFLLEEKAEIELPEYGRITASLVWSGSFMTYVSADLLSKPIGPEVIPEALKLGTAIDKALNEKYDFYHPLKPECRMRNTGSLVCFVTPAERTESGDLRAKTLNIIDRNNYDRGAAGTSTCGRLVLLKSQGVKVEGKTLYNYCMSGEHYDAYAIPGEEVAGRPFLTPELTAKVWDMGRSEFFMEEGDPFPYGFL